MRVLSAFSKIRDKERLIWKSKKEGKIVNKWKQEKLGIENK